MKPDLFYYMCADTCSIALENLEVAIEGLKALNRCNLPDDTAVGEELDVIHFICTYSRFVHINVWEYRTSIGIVDKEILPEFKISLDRIEHLMLGDAGLTKDQTKKLRRFARNIFGRKQNLSERYCKGLPSLFKFDLKDVPSWLNQSKHRQDIALEAH